MKKKKILGIITMLSAFIFTLSSCEAIKDTSIIKGNNDTTVTIDDIVTEDAEEVIDETKEAPEVDEDSNDLTITVLENETLGKGSYEVSDNIYKITSQGEYDINGKLGEGSIVIDTEGEVLINLNGVNINSKTTSPINVINADKVEISAKSGTINYITDSRTEAEDEDLTAAIYSESDLKLKGKGELYIYGNFNNGIHSKDDLDIKNLTLYVKALNNAIKGNDSINIENANVIAISTSGDGLKTTSTDISSKGNQRGTITISGSTKLDIYACCDGIDAAYNVDILADSDGNEPEINVYTNSFSSYSSETPTTISSSNTLYLKLSNSYYSSSYQYYIYNYDTSDKENGVWLSLSYYTQASSNMGFGGRNQSTYYYFKTSLNTKYDGVQVFMFENGKTPSLTDYYATSTGQAINETKDMLTVTSVSSSSKKIGVDWSNYSTQQSSFGPGGMNEGNKDKTSYSTKGIKADNEININAGNILIKSYDDGIHASSNVTLENGNTSTGYVNINGGSITILSKDDGIHSDSNLNINGGNISITQAYEGLEGKNIIINDGIISVYATDDGINAQTSINVSGGTLSIIVASGDTDAIDSNGTYTQTGGVVVSMNLAASGTATALDTDGNVTISGGTFLGFGNLEKTPKLTNVKSTTKQISLSSGTYTLSLNGESLITFKTLTNYSKLYLVGIAGSYTLGNISISL